MDALRKFIYKQDFFSKPKKVKRENTGYVNWENVGNDVDKLVKFVGKYFDD